MNKLAVKKKEPNNKLARTPELKQLKTNFEYPWNGELAFRDVDHSAGRLGVGWCASIVSRVDICHVVYRQLAGDNSIGISKVVGWRPVSFHQSVVDFCHHFNSRTCPCPCPRPAAILRACRAGAAPTTATVGPVALGRHRFNPKRRIVVDHAIVMIPENELRFLRYLTILKSNKHQQNTAVSTLYSLYFGCHAFLIVPITTRRKNYSHSGWHTSAGWRCFCRRGTHFRRRLT